MFFFFVLPASPTWCSIKEKSLAVIIDYFIPKSLGRSPGATKPALIIMFKCIATLFRGIFLCRSHHRRRRRRRRTNFLSAKLIYCYSTFLQTLESVRSFSRRRQCFRYVTTIIGPRPFYSSNILHWQLLFRS